MTGRSEHAVDRLLVAALALTLLARPGVAAAYLDPGTGSLVLQMALAGLLGALFTLKLYWRRLKAWLTRKPLPDDGAQRAGRPDDPR